MELLQNFSIKRKQMLIIMATSSLALLLACAAFVAFDAVTFRKHLVSKVSSLADVVGRTVTAAIDFNDPRTAEELLGALRAEPNVVAACVYDTDGKFFAAYQRDGVATNNFPPVQPAGYQFTREQLHLSLDIKQGGSRVGSIYVISDLSELAARLKSYAGIVIFVFVVSLGAAFLLSTRLQQLISKPVLQLAQLSRTVALEKNYSLRATKASNDELGQLMAGFNEMLDQIQQRDAALLAARDQLERRVQERTGELAYERELLRSLLDNVPDHIYFKDLQSRFIKCSNAMAMQFGVISPDELVGKSDANFFSEEHARGAFEDEQNIIRTGQPIVGRVERETWPDGRPDTWALTTKMPFVSKTGEIIGTFGISKNITGLKEAEARLQEAHQQLLETSRLAGMAEVATNVLHNVGNVLNSVNVSSTLVIDHIKQSKLPYLNKAVQLLEQHAADPGAFLTADPRGQKLPGYLAQLARQLSAEQEALMQELNQLRQNIDHIKEIVAMQQSYAKISGVTETVQVSELVEDALRMNAGALIRHEVTLIRDYAEVPRITVEKHHVLQILVNLIRNAKYACDESGRQDKQLKLQVASRESGVQIAVIDNGIGILPENLTRIFSHGFTTRKQGHGFGLHSGALAAKELGGVLRVHSDGPGCGATFILELPLKPPTPHPA